FIAGHQMLIACVLIKHFPFQVEAETSPHLLKREVLLIQRDGPAPAVLATSPAIDDVPSGTPLAEAIARHPLALQREADAPAYQRRFEEVLTALEGVSPLVEANGLGCAYVGLDGMGEMYGGIDNLLQVLREAVPPGLEPRFGLGPG